MDTAVDSNLISRTKNCKTCFRNVISSFSSLKNCEDCRRKNRLKTAHRSERKRQRIEFFGQNHGSIRGHIPSEDEETRCKENDVRSGTSVMNSKLLHELNGRVALKEMNESLQMTTKAESQTRPSKTSGKQVTLDTDNLREFQTAGAMCEKLEKMAIWASSSGKKLKFYGTYSIVCVPTINDKKRVAIVVKDLRDIAHISFGASGSRSERTDKRSSFSTSYDCNCSSAYPSASVNGSNGANHMDCGGLIKVTAEADDSHPGGIPGQKLSVQVNH